MRTTSDLQQQLMRTVYDEHAGALWGFCLHLSHGDRQHAEDLTQETLLKAWRNPAVLEREPEAVRAWLFTVARNQMIDGWRRARTHPDLPADPASHDEPTADGVDEILQSWLVVDALRTLSQEHRTALVECYYGGHTVVEAAARLGVPVGTVKSRLHYGMRALRLALEERGVTR